MGKATNPMTVSGTFGITPKTLSELGVLDATLAIDTNLFIDPMLLDRSVHVEFNRDAVKEYEQRFEQIAALLVASRAEDDAAWKAAYKLFDFPEVPGTCLGYGAGTIRGSGWGPKLRSQTLRTASQVVEVGMTNPDLFPALALFEDDIGPDRISDMTANIAIKSLAAFNARILKALKLKGEVFNFKVGTFIFLANPYQVKRTPVILVPTDVLRDLPVATDWDGIVDAISHNKELRDQANEHVTSIWAKKTKRDKARLKDQALMSKEAFATLISAMREVSDLAYDVDKDPEGLIRWANVGRDAAAKNPIRKRVAAPKDVDGVFVVVKEIVRQFKHLIEESGLNRELYGDAKKPRHESTAQRLFFAAAYTYCKAFDVDVSPEIDTGNGKIDFKFSRGFEARVLVEIKLSTNNNVVSGFTSQLEVYRASQETTRAIYLVIDVGKMGRKDKDLIAIKNLTSAKKRPVSELEFVDGRVKPTASKR